MKAKGEMPPRKNRNGLTLLQSFIPDGFSHAAISFVEYLKINSISEKQRRNRPIVVNIGPVFPAVFADWSVTESLLAHKHVFRYGKFADSLRTVL